MRNDNLSLWSRLNVWLRQVNVWLLIALLALGALVFDSLRYYLELHQTVWAGLGAFASHFWYAVPLAVAIIVLTRLQPQVKLLGSACYDEVGRLVEQQGDFRLDEFTVRNMLTALRVNGKQGLHNIKLPSGANVYFVREGGRTLLLSFSGPASPQALTAGVERLRGQMPTTFDLLDDLEPPVAALAANVLTTPIKCRVLDFFHQHDRTAIQVSDLAYWVNAPEDKVHQALSELVDLGLVECQSICDCTFYRLNQGAEISTHLDRLFAWRRKWQVTLGRMDQILGHDRTIVRDGKSAGRWVSTAARDRLNTD